MLPLGILIMFRSISPSVFSSSWFVDNWTKDTLENLYSSVKKEQHKCGTCTVHVNVALFLYSTSDPTATFQQSVMSTVFCWLKNNSSDLSRHLIKLIREANSITRFTSDSLTAVTQKRTMAKLVSDEQQLHSALSNSTWSRQTVQRLLFY